MSKDRITYNDSLTTGHFKPNNASNPESLKKSLTTSHLKSPPPPPKPDSGKK